MGTLTLDDLPAAAAILTDDLIDRGAVAVVVVGSYARGEAHRHSDLDMVAIGSGDAVHRVVDGLLVSVDWFTDEKARSFLNIPQLAGQHVPGWRNALIVHDPDGVAERLQRHAYQWRWDDIAAKVDRTVAELVPLFSSNAQHLVGDIIGERWMRAAQTRSILALHCAQIMVMHLRLLYGSEHNLWGAVADAMGPEWRQTQQAAFGFHGEDMAATAAAALKLYRITAENTRHLMTPTQQEMVDVALHAIESLPAR